MTVDLSVFHRVESLFRPLLIRHARASQVREIIHFMRLGKRENPHSAGIWKGLWGASNSGKSKCVDVYLQTVLVPELIAAGHFSASTPAREIIDRQTIVLNVSFPSTNATEKAAMVALLTRIGDPFPKKGSTQDMMDRLAHLAPQKGSEVILLDEGQNLAVLQRRAFRSEGVAWNLAKFVKDLLEQVKLPILFIGEEDGEAYLMGHPSTASRSRPGLKFNRIAFRSAEMYDVFIPFAIELGLAAVEMGLIEREPDFISGHVPACLRSAARGLLGDLSIIMYYAIAYAILDPEADTVLPIHMEKAVDHWVMPTRNMATNPFKRARLEEKRRRARGEADQAG